MLRVDPHVILTRMKEPSGYGFALVWSNVMVNQENFNSEAVTLIEQVKLKLEEFLDSDEISEKQKTKVLREILVIAME